MIKKFKHTTRVNIPTNGFTFDVSSYSKDYSALSPFNKLGNIPHPCKPDLLCISVEAIWQGSKVFDTDNVKPDYFILFGKKNPNKNKGKKPIGTWIGTNKVESDVGEARRKVFIPAYKWTLDHRLKNYVTKLLRFAKEHPRSVIYLYDVDWNADVDNPQSYSHSAYLCDYLNEKYNDNKFMALVMNPNMK